MGKNKIVLTSKQIFPYEQIFRYLGLDEEFTINSS